MIMSTETIITIIILGITALSSILGLVLALVRGDMKSFIVQKMEEAESSGKTGVEKLDFVLEAVKEKYKILQVILNVKKFVEYIIGVSKEINYKK